MLKVLTIFLSLTLLFGCGRIKDFFKSPDEENEDSFSEPEGVYIWKIGDIMELKRVSSSSEHSNTFHVSFLYTVDKEVENPFGVTCLRRVSRAIDETIGDDGLIIMKETRVNKSLFYQDKSGVSYNCGSYEENETEPTFLSSSTDTPNGLEMSSDEASIPSDGVAYVGDVGVNMKDFDDGGWVFCEHEVTEKKTISTPAGKIGAYKIIYECDYDFGLTEVCTGWYSNFYQTYATLSCVATDEDYVSPSLWTTERLP